MPLVLPPLPAPARIARSSPGRGADGNPGWHLLALDIDVLHNQNLTGAGIRIAIIDSGVDLRCPGLAGAAIAVLPGGGTRDGVDGDGHGTSMAAILVGKGIGVCPDAAIVSIAAFTADGAASAAWIADAIDLALARGVDIINISGGESIPSPPLIAAVKRATDAGVIVVAAADNRAPNAPLYPAAIAPVISVTASDPMGNLLHPSPPGWVDVAAPGEDIETYVFARRTTRTGTSEATAIVSGVCALLLEEVPDGRRGAAKQHMAGFVSRTMRSAANATGPNECGIMQPLAALAEVRRWIGNL